MSALDWAQLDALDGASFRAAAPYPHVAPGNLIRPEAFEELRETMPALDRFERYFGIKRSHGQRSHDRFVLNYEPGMDLPAPWRTFVDDLLSPRYRDFLVRLFDDGFVDLSLHWHYTPNGCEVSPHCDAPHKLGSHIFYFNTDQDWDPSWGGNTLILDDDGRYSRRSAPDFSDFKCIRAGNALGNNSLLFQRRGNSWHGVERIDCPPDRYRKVFIVVVNGRKKGLLRRAQDVWRQKPVERAR